MLTTIDNLLNTIEYLFNIYLINTLEYLFKKIILYNLKCQI